MKSAVISSSTLEFLRELKENNNRPWFNAHKEWYQGELAKMKIYSDALLDRMSHYDNIEQLHLFRIYRDVRFSKNKSLYKVCFGGGMKRATKWLRGGYYFHIEPEKSFVGGGFWSPNPPDLKRIREEIAADDQPLRTILARPTFKKTFGSLQGEEVKTAPRGFSKTHAAIDLIRKKQFLLARSFSDAEVLSPNLLDEMVQTFRNMLPFFEYMSEVLTTDANGMPLEHE